jgi:SAM-dependent methyltransferase
VESSHGPIAESSLLIERTGIPRRVLSRLVDVTQMGVGYRVLDVGCGGGELAAYLDSLGIRCVGVDESAINIVGAKRSVPACEFHCGSIGEAVTALKGGFDLVLVREVSVFQASLVSPAAFAASCQLLARVRPGGCLAFLSRVDTASAAAGGHRLACFARHIGSLPGIYDLHEISDGIFSKSFHSRGARAGAGQLGCGYAVAILRLPPQPLSQEQWKQVADRAADSRATSCCPWAAQGGASTAYRSKAA